MAKPVNANIRLRIIQMRASKLERPPTIDVILEQIEKEFGGESVSRGSVGRIIREWELLPDDIRPRELPFEWHLLDRARIPWEASRWVLECQARFEQSPIRAAVEMENSGVSRDDITLWLSHVGKFTNRWACWCWRVHQARPDWKTDRVISIAALYVYSEQSHDLLPSHPPINLPGIQALLSHTPDLWEQTPTFGTYYLYGIDYGVIEDFTEIDSIDETIQAWAGLPGVPDTEVQRVEGLTLGLSIWIQGWRESLAQHLDEIEAGTEESEDARHDQAKV